jgi:pyruvate carboxylase
MGAHFLCIKDMAGLLRPKAAELLITKLRESVGLPIHLHTHDTSGNGIATLMEAVRCGVHVVDVALAPMAGTTSQPSMNALVAALRGHPRESGLTNKRLQPLCDYWEAVREYYAPFEAGLKSCTSEVYYHEIPGGQYSNLRPQVQELGLIKRWNEVKDAFAVTNQLVGDIPKVTPSSKMVGDFATFLVQNDLLVKKDDLAQMSVATHEKLLREAPRLNFPESVVQYFQGYLGRPPGGYPAALRTAVLKGLPIVEGDPSARLSPLDFEALTRRLEDKHGRKMRMSDVVSAALYPRVFDEYAAQLNTWEDVSILDTPTYFYGMEVGQEIWVDLEQGKTLVISLQAIGDPDSAGMRTVWFELNGQARQVLARDQALAPAASARRKAARDDPNQVGASMPGTVIGVHCKEGEEVSPGSPLVTLEAMKMETVLRATKRGRIKSVIPALKSSVEVDDLLVLLE